MCRLVLLSIYACTIECFNYLMYSLACSPTTLEMIPDLTFISAPMVNQSDAPFRLLTRRYGATLTYTQMLDSHRLINDIDYLHYHLQDLQSTHSDWDGCTRPVVVQLCGNDPEVAVSAARRVQSYCDGIGGQRICPTIASHSFAKYLRLEPRMSPGTCTSRSLWRVFAHEEGLAIGGLDRCLTHP